MLLAMLFQERGRYSMLLATRRNAQLCGIRAANHSTDFVDER